MSTLPLATSKSIATLNKLLQGERSAVVTYQAAQGHLDTAHAVEIEANRACHAKRVEVLIKHITEQGGKPSGEGGVWVAFTKTIEQAASLLGNSTVIAALEQGEDIGLSDYKSALDKLDPQSRSLVIGDLLPAQERTHQRMSAIQRAS